MTVAVKNDNRAPLVVPPSIRRLARFKSGQELEFRVSDGAITIVPKLPGVEDKRESARRRAIDRGINQSLREYRAGKVAGPFETVEEFVEDLHRENAKLTAERKQKRARK